MEPDVYEMMEKFKDDNPVHAVALKARDLVFCEDPSVDIVSLTLYSYVNKFVECTERETSGSEILNRVASLVIAASAAFLVVSAHTDNSSTLDEMIDDILKHNSQ